MISIEQNIDELYHETEESTKGIIDGSDTHLDLILAITKPLDILSERFEELNNILHNDVKNMPKEKLRDIVIPRLQSLNKSCLTLIGAIRTCFLYRDVRASLKNYIKQHELLREIMSDIHHYYLTKDDELDNILAELNAI